MTDTICAEDYKWAKAQAYVLKRVCKLVAESYFKEHGDVVSPRKVFQDAFLYGMNALQTSFEGKERNND